MSGFLTNGATQNTPCTPPSLQRRCSLDQQPSRAEVRRTPRLLARCAALRAGRTPLAVAVERAGRRPRPTAPLLPPAHSAGARGSGQSDDAELWRRGPRRRPSPEPAPSRSPSSAGAPPGGRPAGKGGQRCWVWAGGSPRAGCSQVSSPDGARCSRPQCKDRT